EETHGHCVILAQARIHLTACAVVGKRFRLSKNTVRNDGFLYVIPVQTGIYLKTVTVGNDEIFLSSYVALT
ncbi:MAG: hypothetical protein ACJA1S_001722, partial [Cellvibrionaceae bacterium]